MLHELFDGTTVDRSNQYTGTVAHVPGHNEWSWSGPDHNRRITMEAGAFRKCSQEWVRGKVHIMGDQMFPFPNRIELRQSLKRLLLRRKLADKNTFDGEPYTQESLNILRAAETQGYVLSVANNKTIGARKKNVTLFVRSNGDIQRFGQNRGFI